MIRERQRREALSLPRSHMFIRSCSQKTGLKLTLTQLRNYKDSHRSSAISFSKGQSPELINSTLGFLQICSFSGPICENFCVRVRSFSRRRRFESHGHLIPFRDQGSTNFAKHPRLPSRQNMSLFCASRVKLKPFKLQNGKICSPVSGF